MGVHVASRIVTQYTAVVAACGVVEVIMVPVHRGENPNE